MTTTTIWRILAIIRAIIAYSRADIFRATQSFVGAIRTVIEAVTEFVDRDAESVVVTWPRWVGTDHRLDGIAIEFVTAVITVPVLITLVRQRDTFLAIMTSPLVILTSCPVTIFITSIKAVFCAVTFEL
jgi:hypothetical protein